VFPRCSPSSPRSFSRPESFQVLFQSLHCHSQHVFEGSSVLTILPDSVKPLLRPFKSCFNHSTATLWRVLKGPLCSLSSLTLSNPSCVLSSPVQITAQTLSAVFKRQSGILVSPRPCQSSPKSRPSFLWFTALTLSALVFQASVRHPRPPPTLSKLS